MRQLDRLRYSLSARLMALFIAVSAVILVIVYVTVGAALRHQFAVNIRPHIHQYLDYVRRDLGNPPSVARARALAARVPVNIYISSPQVHWSSTGRPPDFGALRFHDEHRRWRRPGRAGFRIGEYADRSVFQTHIGAATVVFEINRRPHDRYALWASAGAVAALLGALALCYLIIRWLFRPVGLIQQGVQRIGAGELNYRIPAERRDELGDLTRSINAMADDIECMLEAKRQLLLGISHELRSPVTRAKISTELLADSHLKGNIATDLREMEQLIAEILETERLNTRHHVLNKAPAAVNALINEVLDTHFAAQAVERRLLIPDAVVALDAARIRLLLSNLVGNALRHSAGAAHSPVVRTQLAEGLLRLIVEDYGPGIAAEHLARLTEPFYRVDPSRQRKTGGYGLGLYLCRMIAEAHGGRLTIESVVGQGTTVQVELPVG